MSAVPQGTAELIAHISQPSPRGLFSFWSDVYPGQQPGFPLIWTALALARTRALLIGWYSIGAVPAPGVTAASPFQVISCRKYEVGAVVVIILSWAEFCSCRWERWLGW
jgi:hypothetical protein